MARKKRKRTPASAKHGRSSNRIGRDFERRVANKLGGEIHTGQDGDVKARGYMIECKSRQDLKLHSTTEWREIHDQLMRYVRNDWPRGQKYALAYTGGKSCYNAQIWVSIPIEEFIRLTDADQMNQVVEQVLENNPDMKESLWELVVQVASKLNEEESM